MIRSKNIILDRSYDYCRMIAKTQAKNFYYSFTVLPPDKRAAMCAIYAFMRYSDDISDEDRSDKKEMISRWRAALDEAFTGEYGDNLILPAFHDVVRKYSIPRRFFYDVIDGAEMDLYKTRYETFEELREYCYKVAAVVGLVCIHIWGFSGGEATYSLAETCGYAFQLTNILRDVREDAERGRIYLPLEDLRRFGLKEDDILNVGMDERFTDLIHFEVERTDKLYKEAYPLTEKIDSVSQSTFLIMYRIYHGLLDKIRQQKYDVFSDRASLSTGKKAGIVAKAWLDSRFKYNERLLKL